MENKESSVDGLERLGNSAWSQLSEQPFVGETTKSKERINSNVAINIHDIHDDFFEGSEIIEGRAADSVCRKAKPNKITGAMTYDEVMAVTPDLSEDLQERFFLEDEDLPIFSQQAQSFRIGDRPGAKNTIDVTLGSTVSAHYHVGATIDTIDKVEQADIVVYLDKSARPVSWFVNEFWEEFSDKERPAEANLAIDRMQWFPRANVDVDGLGYLTEESGNRRKATYLDFEKGAHNIPLKTIAQIRALFIPNGVNTDDPETIMNTPTGLDGKKFLVVDEVSDSGATSGIAKWLIEHAIPEAASVDTHIYWNLGKFTTGDGSGTSQMNKSPVWYSPEKADVVSGRGVLDINTTFFEKSYQSNPNSYTLAQEIGAFVLGEPIDVDEEVTHRSRDIQIEIRKMHQEYRMGHILPNMGNVRSPEIWDKFQNFFASLGVVFEVATGNKIEDRNKYATLIEKLKKDLPRL